MRAGHSCAHIRRCFAQSDTATIESAKGATHQLPASILPLPRPSTRPRAWILFQQRAAVPWSFTDRTRKIVIDDLGIKTVLALDGHFRHGGLDVQG